MKRILFIRALERCNANCYMCSFSQSTSDYQFRAGDAESLLKHLGKDRLSLVRLTGGEPLLLEECGEIIEVFHQARIKTSIISNGWFLHERLQDLGQSGLDQVIISLDHHQGEIHDRIRGLPGLFARVTENIQEVKHQFPKMIIRVNSVVSEHNYQSLEKLYDLLAELKVDQWSIIPIKGNSEFQNTAKKKQLLAAYRRFKSHLQEMKEQTFPKLLGYSGSWMGRTKEDIEEFFLKGYSFRPRDICNAVRLIWYYLPAGKRLAPCNCCVHNQGNRRLITAVNDFDFDTQEAKMIEDWLHKNGPKWCTGCEPLNAALGDSKINIQLNPLEF